MWLGLDRFSAFAEIQQEVHYFRYVSKTEVVHLGFSREKINVTRVNTVSKHNQADMQFSIEVTDLEQLSKLLSMLHQVPNLVSAKRRA